MEQPNCETSQLSPPLLVPEQTSHFIGIFLSTSNCEITLIRCYRLHQRVQIIRIVAVTPVDECKYVSLTGCLNTRQTSLTISLSRFLNDSGAGIFCNILCGICGIVVNDYDLINEFGISLITLPIEASSFNAGMMTVMCFWLSMPLLVQPPVVFVVINLIKVLQSSASSLEAYSSKCSITPISESPKSSRYQS